MVTVTTIHMVMRVYCTCTGQDYNENFLNIKLISKSIFFSPRRDFKSINNNNNDKKKNEVSVSRKKISQFSFPKNALQ